jgi:hypothetical protein
MAMIVRRFFSMTTIASASIYSSRKKLNASNTVSIKPKATLDKIIAETCRYSHLEEKDYSIKGKDHKLLVARGKVAWQDPGKRSCPKR